MIDFQIEALTAIMKVPGNPGNIVIEKFSYNFGGKIYYQKAGGAMGARLTISC